VQVAAEKKQQDRPARKQSIPHHLQLPVESGVLLGEPGQLIKHDDARLVGQFAGEDPEHVAPAAGRGCAGQQRVVVRQIRRGQIGQELSCRFGDRRTLNGGEVQVGQAGSVAELLH